VSFRHQGLKRLYERGDRSKIGADLVNKIENILATLDAADSLQALDLPGYRLHPLKGSRKGFWAITVRSNWGSFFASRTETRVMLSCLIIIRKGT